MELKKFTRTHDVVAYDWIWELSVRLGCIDQDRCNERIQPSGSCDECLEARRQVIVDLEKEAGWKLAKIL